MPPFECPIPISEHDRVTLAHGSGGKLALRLIREMLLPAFDNPALSELHDGAVVDWDAGSLAISTDSFVVRPPFFPGGDIGMLAVHGTTNDLAMCGARPLYLSLGLILEEGFPLRDLWRVISSIRAACEQLAVSVVTGDTKVVERGNGDGIFINTTGLGRRLDGIEVAPSRVRPGDRVLLSGPIAEHGVAILSRREGLEFEGDVASDTAALWPAVEPLLGGLGRAVHALRDATRGGVASVLNEIAMGGECGVVIDGPAVPVREPVRAACEMLGLDPLYVANEGRFVAFVEGAAADRALEILRECEVAAGACEIARVVAEHPGVVRLESGFGGSRVVDLLTGDPLPRIC